MCIKITCRIFLICKFLCSTLKLLKWNLFKWNLRDVYFPDTRWYSCVQLSFDISYFSSRKIMFPFQKCLSSKNSGESDTNIKNLSLYLSRRYQLFFIMSVLISHVLVYCLKGLSWPRLHFYILNKKHRIWVIWKSNHK